MKAKLTKAGAFGLSCLFSILLFMIVCWSAAFHDTTPYWIESIGFFLLTYICIDRFSKRITGINPWMIGLAVILGQLIFHIPARATDFSGSLGSLMIVVSCIIAIILAVFCYTQKRAYAFVISYIVISLFNSFVAEAWSDYVLGLMR